MQHHGETFMVCFTIHRGGKDVRIHYTDIISISLFESDYTGTNLKLEDDHDIYYYVVDMINDLEIELC